MTLQKLASLIAKREGKRSQAKIGDIREMLGILADILHEGAVDEGDFESMFRLAGEKRAKRKGKRTSKVKAKKK